MLARTPHCAAVQREPAGTTNVHQVPSGGALTPGSPFSDCFPCAAVSMPSEKLDPSGPGSLTAVPDSPRRRRLSHADTVNERRGLISARVATADCPGPEIDSAGPNG